MAFNGTGTFNRLYTWVTDKINSIPITASRMDAEMDGMATGLSSCITKDGQTTITANIPMASHKFTGLSTGNARTDSITLGQVQDGQFTALGTTSGSADAYTASPTPAITAYVATMEYSAKINATNTTTTPYLQLSGIGTPASDAVIKKLNASKVEIAVEASDMLENGIYRFKRNSANTAWILINPENNPTLTATTLTATKLALPSSSTLTIASGVVTVTGSNHLIDTESSAASDDLDTINGGSNGMRLILGNVADARNVVLKHNTGNIFNPIEKDITIDLTTDKINLVYSSTLSKWIVVSLNYKSAFLNSKATSGYTYLPNGLILQWGLGSSNSIGANASRADTLTFPITFPNAIFGVNVTNNTFGNVINSASILTTSNFSCSQRNHETSGSQNSQPFYFAVGN